jgi:protein-disulfide isomerase
MTRIQFSFAALLSAAVLTTACLPERGKPPANKPVAAAPGKPGAPTTTPPPKRVPPPPGTSLCEQSAIRFEPNTVVARVEGKDITIEEIGADLASAESRALRTYCGEVARVREAALDNMIQQKLLTAAAEKAGKPLDKFVQDYVDSQVKDPDDAEIQSFYDARKSPDAPPLEMVRDQVVQAIKGEKSQGVFETLLGELRTAAKVENLLPDVRPPALQLLADHSPRAGQAGAPIQVVEFSDFECPYCSRAADTLKQLKDKYAGQPVEFVFRHFPLSFHPNAKPAAEYAQCAHEQDKFWAMHDAIFAGQSAGLSTDKFKEMATQAGLDTAKLEECVASGRAKTLVEEDLKKGGEAGVGGTPSFYINGQAFEGNPTPQGLAQAIDAELARLKG